VRVAQASPRRVAPSMTSSGTDFPQGPQQVNRLTGAQGPPPLAACPLRLSVCGGCACLPALSLILWQFPTHEASRSALPNASSARRDACVAEAWCRNKPIAPMSAALHSSSPPVPMAAPPRVRRTR